MEDIWTKKVTVPADRIYLSSHKSVKWCLIATSVL